MALKMSPVSRNLHAKVTLLGLELEDMLFLAMACAVAMLIDVTHPAVHATVTATAVLGASLLGMAPGPYVVGLISDVATLKTALTIAPLMSLGAAIMFILASRHYESDLAKRQRGAV